MYDYEAKEEWRRKADDNGAKEEKKGLSGESE